VHLIENTIEQIVSKLKSSNDLSVLIDFYNWKVSRIDRKAETNRLSSNGKEYLESLRKMSKKSGDTKSLSKVEQEYKKQIDSFNKRIAESSFSYKILNRTTFSVQMEITRTIGSEKIVSTLEMYEGQKTWLFNDLRIFNLTTPGLQGQAPFGGTLNPLSAISRE